MSPEVSPLGITTSPDSTTRSPVVTPSGRPGFDEPGDGLGAAHAGAAAPRTTKANTSTAAAGNRRDRRGVPLNRAPPPPWRRGRPGGSPAAPPTTGRATR